jgi:hypothetical protein
MKDLLGATVADGAEFLEGEGPVEEYKGRILASSAAGIRFTDSVFNDWLPRSKILIDGVPGPDAGNNFERHEIFTLTIPDWLAKKKGLIE